MSLADFRDMLNDTITVEPVVMYDDQSKPTYGSPVQRKGRVEEKVERVYDAEGQERFGVATVWLATTENIAEDSRVTLPSGMRTRVVSVARVNDEYGPHHIKLIVGR